MENHGMIQVPDFDPASVRRAVYIGRDAWSDMCHLTEIPDIEISWLGLVEETSFGPYVREVILPKQTCSPVGTEMDQIDLAEVFHRLAKEGRSHELLFWGHSHVEMSARFSGIDTKKMAEWGGECRENDPDWFVNLVMNKRRELQCVVEFFKPLRLSIEVPVYLGDPRKTMRRWREQIEAKMTRGAVHHQFSSSVDEAQIRRGA